MDRLRCLEFFAEVARAGSFTAAAQRFAISRSSVTQQMAWLEHSLCAQLLERTMGRTDAGLRPLDSRLQLPERLNAIQAELRDAVDRPRRVIRVGRPHSFGVQHLRPLALRFTALHPPLPTP